MKQLAPPHSEDIEQVILGTYFAFPKTQEKLNSFLKPEKFHIQKHALIYILINKYLRSLKSYDTTVDIVSFLDFLDHQDNGALENCGGRDYIVDIVAGTSTSAGIDSHLDTLDDYYVRRDIITKCHDLINSCQDNYGAPVGELIGDMEIILEYGNQKINLAQEIKQIVDNNPHGSISSTIVHKELQLSTWGDKQKARKIQKNISTIFSRLESEGRIKKTNQVGTYLILDKKANFEDWKSATYEQVHLTLPLGMHECVKLFPGSIIVFAGVTNSGKTAMAMQFIKLNCCEEKPIYYFSTEVHVAQFRERAVAHAPAETWSNVNFSTVNPASIADQIVPDEINIIDYLKPPESDYAKMAPVLDDIQNVLKGGIAVVCIQKKKGSEYSMGGEHMMAPTHLFCTLDVVNYPVFKMTIKKCKATNDGYRNPYDLDVEYRVDRDGVGILPFGKFCFDRWRD